MEEVILLNIHGIEKDSILNGDGIRVVLWVSGCEHHCKGCFNPETHDPNSGYEMTTEHFCKICNELEKDYVSGLTFLGGDPLYLSNRITVCSIAEYLKYRYPNKTIWLYTGYEFEQIKHLEILNYLDVIVDGKFIQELADNKLHWRGSSNQKVWRKLNGTWKAFDS